MNNIMQLVSDIHNELDSIYSYAMMSVKYKSCDKELSDVYFNVANTQISNVNSMHSILNKKINAAAVGGNEDIKEIYTWETNNIIENIAKIKSILESAKKA